VAADDEHLGDLPGLQHRFSGLLRHCRRDQFDVGVLARPGFEKLVEGSQDAVVPYVAR
jgi:hypothetical protein